ncbi:unnamed protein product [Cuscuta epithymum]|uniref:Protein JASON n=1 Tax=Cuscuta epithymum TaxID=186058 RepID=A0AAV0F4Q1_9ASTE|nr:unnamed protein product [Cuscuta epithymum]
MGCFFGCFRFGRDGSAADRQLPPSDHASRSPRVSNTTEPVVSRNRSPLSSLFVSEENEEETNLQSNGVEKLGCTTEVLEVDINELKHQAKFLKACGTLPETPIEIKKLSGNKCNSDLSSPQMGELDEPLKISSLFPDTYIEKQNTEIQPNNLSLTKDCVEWVDGSSSSFRTPSSCMTCEEDSSSVNISSTSPSTVPPVTACRQKHVHFERNSDKKPSEVASPNSKHSPYPTPLKLTDEMQTPGTIFSTYVENLPKGKNPRIRSEYVYAVLNPVENASQLKKAKDEEDSESAQDSNFKSSLNEVNCTPNMGLKETTSENNVNVEASLSSWLQPPFNQQSHGRTKGDRPILGMVAAHWNERETSSLSPKWWGGNGIPNSTHKYKEDQKVSWHATPFEERLEKALSEETLVSQRKLVSGSPISFKETEESDTALSQFQSGSQHDRAVLALS